MGAVAVPVPALPAQQATATVVLAAVYLQACLPHHQHPQLQASTLKHQHSLT